MIWLIAYALGVVLPWSLLAIAALADCQHPEPETTVVKEEDPDGPLR